MFLVNSLWCLTIQLLEIEFLHKNHKFNLTTSKNTKKTNASYIIISIGQKSFKILTANSLNPFSDQGHDGLYTFIQNCIFNISYIVCVGGHLNVKSEILRCNQFFKSLWNSKNSSINFTGYLETKKLLKFVWQSDNFSFYYIFDLGPIKFEFVL